MGRSRRFSGEERGFPDGSGGVGLAVPEFAEFGALLPPVAEPFVVTELISKAKAELLKCQKLSGFKGKQQIFPRACLR